MNYRLKEIQVIFSRISLIRPLDLLTTPTQFNSHSRSANIFSGARGLNPLIHCFSIQNQPAGVLRKGNWTRNKYFQLFILIKTISGNFRFAVLKRKCVGRSFVMNTSLFFTFRQLKGVKILLIGLWFILRHCLSVRLSSDRVIFNVKDFNLLAPGLFFFKF